MVDQALGTLEQYDLEIRGVRKGRGNWIVNCMEGDFVLKEYRGSEERAYMQNALTDKISKETSVLVQEIVPNKEGNLLVKDCEERGYTLQTFFEGRECNLKEGRECEAAMKTLAKMHKAMELSEKEIPELPPVYSLQKEFAKHNAELRRIRRYLKEKHQKNEFERFLHKNIPSFLEKAMEVEADWSCYEEKGKLKQEKEDVLQFCHGDFQHHNVWLDDREIMILQFEKYLPDMPCRDLYLFLRKFLEKNNWNITLGRELLHIYEKERPLPLRERISMIYRFAYPEKFWKIANYYFNSKKSFIPEKSMEKLEKLLEQEAMKEAFVNQVLREVM